jgi:hypothetical protein
VTATFAVTFEFETTPPLTTRGTVSASQMPTCLARAARQAMQAHPGQSWRSLVVVLERVSAEPQTLSEEIPA